MVNIAEMERTLRTLEFDLADAWEDLNDATDRLLGASLDRKRRLAEALNASEAFDIAIEYAEQVQVLKALIAETKKARGTQAD